MLTKNIVFIAKSLDGFIAGKNGEIDWLHSIPNPENIDMGYGELMAEVDAIVMGRTTYEVVCGFGGEWPYDKPVYVLSTTIKTVPDKLQSKITIIQGTPQVILNLIHSNGHHTLYIDGGSTVQNFLKEDLIDELRITTIPILLGGGFPLFGALPKPLHFQHIKSELYLNQVVQDHFKRR